MTIDAVRERKPPFVPNQVVAEYAELLRTYHVTAVYGDDYAKGFHASEWAEHSVQLRKSENSTSDNYLAALPTFLARRVHLIDNATLRNQLISLERTVGARDKENISHPKHSGAHDDVATAVCGAIVTALWAAKLAEAQKVPICMPFFDSSGCTVPGGSSLW